MKFNSDKFESAKFYDRTSEVPVDGLSDFFGLSENEKPVWVVKNLESEDIAAIDEYVERARILKTGPMKAAIDAGPGKAAAEAVNILLGGGSSKKTPIGLVKEMRMLFYATVSPKVDYPIIVKLAQVKPVEFKRLLLEVVRLAGLGATTEKPEPCGEIQGSGQLANSVTNGVSHSTS